LISPLFLFLLVPIAGYVILRSENIQLDRKKLYAGFFILLLVAVTPAFSFQPAFADNEIRQVIKIVGLYPADVASVEFVIDPPLENIDKTFIIFTVRHTGENDASDTIKSIEIIDVNTIRLKGEDTATGNNAVEFIAYIIEYDPSSTIDVQHIQESLASTSGTQTFTMASVNETNSMIISRGQHLNVSATAVGNNDFLRIRIISPTTWEVNIDSTPDTPQGSLVAIVLSKSCISGTVTSIESSVPSKVELKCFIFIKPTGNSINSQAIRSCESSSSLNHLISPPSVNDPLTIKSSFGSDADPSDVYVNINIVLVGSIAVKSTPPINSVVNDGSTNVCIPLWTKISS